MNQIARCDWLPERARWSHLAPSGLSALSRKQNYPKSHIINPLLTKFDRSRWLGIGLVLFCEFMDRDEVEVHKHAKRELGQYPAILTSHLVNNPYVMPTGRLIMGRHKTHSRKPYNKQLITLECTVLTEKSQTFAFPY